MYVCLQARTGSQDEQDQDGVSPTGSNGTADLCPRKVDMGNPKAVDTEEEQHPCDGSDAATPLVKPSSTTAVRDVDKPTAKDGQLLRTSPVATTFGSGTS